MTRFTPVALMLLAVGAAAPSAPAAAQCRLCDQPATDRPADSADGDVELRVETGLDFDRLIFTGSGNGAATVRPDGSNGAEGIVEAVGPRATVGTVFVHGAPGRTLRVDIPHRIELYSLNGSRVTLDAGHDRFAPHPPARFGRQPQLSLRRAAGGDGEPDGQYRGDLPITVEYL